jgi:hypothetical protein
VVNRRPARGSRGGRPPTGWSPVGSYRLDAGARAARSAIPARAARSLAPIPASPAAAAYRAPAERPPDLHTPSRNALEPPRPRALRKRETPCPAAPPAAPPHPPA